jgi:hypothetical protein
MRPFTKENSLLLFGKMGSFKNNVPPSYRIEKCCQLSIGFWMKNRFPWGSFIVPNHLRILVLTECCVLIYISTLG